jgi:hypothetical protein
VAVLIAAVRASRGCARRLTRRLATAAGAIVLTAASAWGAVDGLVTRESDLKAAFLFHFAHFVTWPEHAFTGPEQPFTIAILGRDPFGGALDQIVAGEFVDGRPMRVLHVESPEAFDTAHIAYVSDDEEPRFRDVLAVRAGVPMLSVGDSRDFARRHGMIGFVTVGRRVRVQINLGQTQAAGLEISSMLLRQAQIVGTARPWR